MEQLKPILAQKFWILLGVGLIVSFVGWSMASGAMSKVIDERIGKIKTARDNAGKGDAPNETWQAALAKINEQQSVLVDAAKYKLWQEETAVMEWPESMIPYLRKAKAYRGEMNDAVALTVYRNDYPRAFEGVWKTVRPVIPYENGIVDFPMAKMMPYRSWGNLTPTYKEIWEAQEDLWLFKALLKSILVVNGGEEGTKLDASIHAIQRLELLGGDRSTIGASSAGGGGEGGMAGMMGASSDDGGSGALLGGAGAMPGGGTMGGFGAGGTGGADMMGGGRARASAEFDPTEEFGSAGGGAAAGGGNMGMMSGSMMGAGDLAAGDGGGGGQTAAAARRYIDDDENQPYQTRGFYLSVIMDHRRVPNLLCELTANEYSPFPVEIVRVQIARLNDDSPGGSQLQMAMGGGLGGSSVPGGAGLPGALAGAETGFVEESGAGLAGFPGATGPMPGGTMSGMPGTGGRVGGPDPYLADPFMAQVAIAGIMRIYRKASAPVAPGSTNPAPAAEAVPASVAEEPPATTPAEGTPADGAAPGEPAAAPANGATPAAPTPPPAAPAEGTPPSTPAAPPASPPPADDAPPPK